MMLLLRAITRVIGALLMIALALIALGVAGYCFDALISLGSARPDRLAHLPSVRTHVGNFLLHLAQPGPTAGLALLCGIGAMLLGLLLLWGVLWPRGHRMVILEHDSTRGNLAARPRVLRDIVAGLLERVPGVAGLDRPKLSASRHGSGGRVKVAVARTRTSDPGEVERAVTERLNPISRPFNLRSRVRVRIGRNGERVQ